MTRDQRTQELRRILIADDGLAKIVEIYAALFRHCPEWGISPYEMIDDIVAAECAGKVAVEPLECDPVV